MYFSLCGQSTLDTIAPVCSIWRDVPADTIPRVVAEMPYPKLGDCAQEPERASSIRCAQQMYLLALYEHYQAPPLARQLSIDGTCVYTFIVRADGKVENLECIRDVGSGLGTAGLEAIQQLHATIDWEPGRQDGKCVDVRYTIPLRVRLE